MKSSWKEACYAQARRELATHEWMTKSFSGADQAESAVHLYLRGVWIDLSEGLDLEEALAKGRAKWISYAKEQQAKVVAASKIKRGPSSGHSTIGHRWVSEGFFDLNAIHIRQMVSTFETELESPERTDRAVPTGRE